MPGPVSTQGEARDRNYTAEDTLQLILQELRAIKYVLCKIEGTTDPTDVDAGFFSDSGLPSGNPGS
jgi:hypothetical protein